MVKPTAASTSTATVTGRPAWLRAAERAGIVGLVHKRARRHVPSRGHPATATRAGRLNTLDGPVAVLHMLVRAGTHDDRVLAARWARGRRSPAILCGAVAPDIASRAPQGTVRSWSVPSSHACSRGTRAGAFRGRESRACRRRRRPPRPADALAAAETLPKPERGRLAGRPADLSASFDDVAGDVDACFPVPALLA